MLNFSSVLIIVALSGCDARFLPASKADIKKKFEKEVSQSKGCEEDTQCELINPGCPLGCNVVINAAHKEKIQDLAKDLIKQYELTSASCRYKCPKKYPVCYIDKCDAMDL